ncbi:Dabb family protein [Rhodohalobacter sulfatireducens]|uniref:Dabb family protein n=1 Tax=Rhodohalobacter sulfatireducens TaxID=2911366 RepID=A0ABS9KBX9_9BACT|nr:Dabb family protein [Rhodohalobacter sulfatireducens]MCG2588335.1 Dabb family protein [Rhodohalobacter sulfatireducens]
MKRTLFVLTLALAFFATACQQSQDNSMEMQSESSNEISTSTTENTIGMLQHTVYFYLNEDVTEEERQQFEEGLEALLSIEEIYRSEMGVPAGTPDREVTDHSFGYSIFTWFETMDDYEVYAEHPDHMEFIDQYESLWADVKVYDTQVTQAMD